MTPVLYVLIGIVIGYLFGQMDSTACRQRATFAEAEVDRYERRIEQLIRELDEARKGEPTTVAWPNSGGVAQ